MADITQLILSKYYGFSADPENRKFLSSHDGTYDPCKYDSTSCSNELAASETTKVLGEQATSLEISKVEEGDFEDGDVDGNNVIVRSSRAIPEDDSLENDENNLNPNEASSYDLELPNDEKHAKSDKNDDQDDGIRNDSNLGHFEDVISDNISDISSIHTKKKSKMKSLLTTTSMGHSMQHQSSVPKKLPPCNGIFLDLNNLSLVEFPINVIADVPNLRMLYLDNNSLTILPEELFTNLKLLQWLDVRNNKLSSLPMIIKYHTCLETILLQGNQFEKLPLELGLITSLKDLQTAKNPLIFPPADVLALGSKATINCLRNEWNKLNPGEAIESPKPERKSKSLSILSCDPPIPRKLSNCSRTFGSSSTGHVDKSASRVSVRERSKNYKPSNRCENRNDDEKLEERLIWIRKVKEMLIKQAATLQRIKDRDALSDWRRVRRSYDKSMIKAENRTADDIPFGVDLKDFELLFNNKLTIPNPTNKSKNRTTVIPRNINEKMRQLYDSINRLQRARQTDQLSPRAEQKLLENEIKKLVEVQEEIQNLKRYNDETTEAFENSELLPQTQSYRPPPSIII